MALVWAMGSQSLPGTPLVSQVWPVESEALAPTGVHRDPDLCFKMMK